MDCLVCVCESLLEIEGEVKDEEGEVIIEEGGERMRRPSEASLSRKTE